MGASHCTKHCHFPWPAGFDYQRAPPWSFRRQDREHLVPMLDIVKGVLQDRLFNHQKWGFPPTNPDLTNNAWEIWWYLVRFTVSNKNGDWMGCWWGYKWDIPNYLDMILVFVAEIRGGTQRQQFQWGKCLTGGCRVPFFRQSYIYWWMCFTSTS